MKQLVINVELLIFTVVNVVHKLQALASIVVAELGIVRLVRAVNCDKEEIFVIEEPKIKFCTRFQGILVIILKKAVVIIVGLFNVIVGI